MSRPVYGAVCEQECSCFFPGVPSGIAVRSEIIFSYQAVIIQGEIEREVPVVPFTCTFNQEHSFRIAAVDIPVFPLIAACPVVILTGKGLDFNIFYGFAGFPVQHPENTRTIGVSPVYIAEGR